MAADYSHERALGGTVCGVDECGRGALVGPVVAAAVVIPPDSLASLDGVDDSKALTAARREALSAVIRERCLFAIGEADVEEISRLNILNATFLAMSRAVAGLSGAGVTHVLVDGNRIPPRLPSPATALVKGDSLSLSIAAASIVAKVHRDAMLARMHLESPGYGWDSNAGYGTPDHLAALSRLGPTPYHRRTFAGVRELLEPTQLGLF